jgi:hypothetical protein
LFREGDETNAKPMGLLREKKIEQNLRKTIKKNIIFFLIIINRSIRKVSRTV